MRCAWLSGFRSESIVSLLSVYTVALRALLSSGLIVSIASRALSIARCSAWLFEHRLSNLYLICVTSFVPINIAAPDSNDFFALTSICVCLNGGVVVVLRYSDYRTVGRVWPILVV